MIYDGKSWSIKFPADWSASAEDNCVTFSANPPHGVLQVSAHHKNSGLVTDDDLKDFAEDRQLEQVQFHEFSGFSSKSNKNGQVWYEWWLRSAYLMIYATYIVDSAKATFELNEVSGMLSSLVNTMDDSQ